MWIFFSTKLNFIFQFSHAILTIMSFKLDTICNENWNGKNLDSLSLSIKILMTKKNCQLRNCLTISGIFGRFVISLKKKEGKDERKKRGKKQIKTWGYRENGNHIERTQPVLYGHLSCQLAVIWKIYILYSPSRHFHIKALEFGSSWLHQFSMVLVKEMLFPIIFIIHFSDRQLDVYWCILWDKIDFGSRLFRSNLLKNDHVFM